MCLRWEMWPFGSANGVELSGRKDCGAIAIALGLFESDQPSCAIRAF